VLDKYNRGAILVCGSVHIGACVALGRSARALTNDSAYSPINCGWAVDKVIKKESFALAEVGTSEPK